MREMTLEERLADSDYDDNGELDVEVYPLPPGLIDYWNDFNKSLDMAFVNSPDTSPGPGLGINYFINIPNNVNQYEGTDIELDELVGDENTLDSAIHQDPEIYLQNNPEKRNIHEIEPPEMYIEAHEEAREDIERNREFIENFLRTQKPFENKS